MTLARTLPSMNSKATRGARTRVALEDLDHLGTIQSILGVLNEPAASAPALARFVEQVPVLRARLDAKYSARFGTRSTVVHELVLLGNRTFEELLFQLLEDLTELHMEQIPESQAA